MFFTLFFFCIWNAVVEAKLNPKIETRFIGLISFSLLNKLAVKYWFSEFSQHSLRPGHIYFLNRNNNNKYYSEMPKITSEEKCFWMVFTEVLFLNELMVYNMKTTFL